MEFEHPDVIRLLENPRRIQAAALNIGIGQARGDIIIRCDAHARYGQEYIRTCVDALESSGADVVGGSQIATGETYFQKVVAIAYNSYLGSGGAKYRDPNYSGSVDTVWLGAYRKEIFSDGFRFNEMIGTDEDYELFSRLHSKGKRIYLSSTIHAYYFPRENPWKLSKQFFIHGKSVSLTIRYNPKRLIGRPLIILSAIIFFLISNTAAFFSHKALFVFTISILAYCAIILSPLIFYFGKKPFRYLLALPFVLIIIHFSYSIGLFLGFLRFLILWFSSAARIKIVKKMFCTRLVKR
jgi:cellulose synthase/poly-beta-1,6-N-acetylglucosamine synthase-like glycosyltransferase